MTADTVGGIWDYALELAGGLSRHGIHVTLAVMGREPTPAQRQSALTIPRLDLHHGDFLLDWMAKPEDDLRRADVGCASRFETAWLEQHRHHRGDQHG